MSYIKRLLPFYSSLKIKELLVNHDGEIKERVCILLWQYIVTLEHGTHLHMHFSTWVIPLSSIPANSQSILPPLSCPRILSRLVALGDWYHSHVNTAKSFHAHVQEKLGHLSTVNLPSIMLVIYDSVSHITLMSNLLQNIFDHVSCR